MLTTWGSDWPAWTRSTWWWMVLCLWTTPSRHGSKWWGTSSRILSTSIIYKVRGQASTKYLLTVCGNLKEDELFQGYLSSISIWFLVSFQYSEVIKILEGQIFWIVNFLQVHRDVISLIYLYDYSTCINAVFRNLLKISGWEGPQKNLRKLSHHKF